MFALVRQQYEHLFRKYEKRYFVKGDIRSNFGFQKFEADQLVIDFGLRKTDNSFLRFRQSVNLCFFLNMMIKRQLNGPPFRMAAP